jgi:hypothetical protein
MAPKKFVIFPSRALAGQRRPHGWRWVSFRQTEIQ